MASDKQDFNWKAAAEDVEERGGDTDLLFTRNEKNRDSFLREMDLNPNDYKKNSNKSSASKNDDGCYIATCVYGDYDCPEVWTLRRYRDNTLGRSIFGRAFIRCYYFISPTIVKMFGSSPRVKHCWKDRLDPFVRKLRIAGVSDKPYQDKNWRKRK